MKYVFSAIYYCKYAFKMKRLYSFFCFCSFVFLFNGLSVSIRFLYSCVV
ncbi:hypothetical protein HMPREF0645_1524 [Hallella bergensis DSM 17361]|uniref:Uncharacterized protein n=1 Tax=Hallella bergensis DSM 17361 TaxID=585502 RepID=D1PX39_9BACT|nr:hypothetical protein HMPREF0645_1524 [Hallella bergensis DSM 17361]